jgi:hypothetical protein
MENIDQSQPLGSKSANNNNMSNFPEASFPTDRDATSRPGTNGRFPEELPSAGSTRSSMKPSGNTHNNIFGDPPVSPRRAGKVYHMSSDIFGVGSIVNRSGQHMNTPDHQGFQDFDPSSPHRVAGDANKELGGRIERQGSNTKLPDDWKPNARENGCNPVTGDGYAEGDAGKTQKRHYQRSRSQSLW